MFIANPSHSAAGRIELSIANLKVDFATLRDNAPLVAEPAPI
jgi:hypothetical protein